MNAGRGSGCLEVGLQGTAIGAEGGKDEVVDGDLDGGRQMGRVRMLEGGMTISF